MKVCYLHDQVSQSIVLMTVSPRNYFRFLGKADSVNIGMKGWMATESIVYLKTYYNMVINLP